MRRLIVLIAALMLTGCAPLLAQRPGDPPEWFKGPYVAGETFVSFDGAPLGLTTWLPPEGEPWAVIVGVHGMNDYANAFHFAGEYWAEQGIATYAYDQRGFGRSPNRGVWGGDETMVEDLRAVTAFVRRKHPDAVIAVMGESMGGAIAIKAFASSRPPDADRLILSAPAVWGWSSQPLPYKTALWLAAHVTGSKVYTPPSWITRKIQASDNRDELIAMGKDPLMIWGARSDTLYHLVSAMDSGLQGIDEVEAPILYLYGANDEIIPKRPSFKAAAQLKPSDRTAYYRRGYHLLMRDKQRQVVFDDVVAWLKDAQGPLPSGAPAIPRREREREPDRRVVAAGRGA
ncbi:alpha/beta hydrolase [Phenylobacterium terrae]|uniref:Alpha/beta hydrolase n=1 Tax=Phenylobacterium terrae TaxID=2665495 RepID=A0ABW4MYB9_9CAUL